MKVFLNFLKLFQKFQFLFLDTLELVEVIAVIDGKSDAILAKPMLPAFIYSALIQLSPEQRNDEEVLRNAILQSYLE